MLGGSFWVALLRNTMSIGLMMAFFLMLDRPRCPMRKAIGCYVACGGSMIAGYSLWYLLETASFVRYSGLSSLLVVGVFCGLMSRDVLYLTLYKMGMAFYLLSLCVFCGVDVARWWYGGNMWVDILVRAACVVVILFFTWKKLRKQFLGGIDFLMEEMDMFSAMTLLVSIMIGTVVAYWPNLQGFSIFNMVRAFVTLFMAGVLQYAILHLYIHLGYEHYYQSEKELLEMNEKLLHGQMELMQESEKEAARIYHDVRHHMLLLQEYARKEEYGELMEYLTQYGADVENKKIAYICGNRAVNSILSAYAKKARGKGIHVKMDVKVREGLKIRDIDWVAILANIFENAIHGCEGSSLEKKEISIYIAEKGEKVAIRFSNTNTKKVEFKKGLPKSDKGSGLGVGSIRKAASRYGGEAYFEAEEGRFVTEVVLYLPKEGDVAEAAVHLPGGEELRDRGGVHLPGEGA